MEPAGAFELCVNVVTMTCGSRKTLLPHMARFVCQQTRTRKGFESLVPISGSVRAAIDRVLRKRPGVGRLPLFPSAKDGKKSISRHIADSWLPSAETLDELEPQRGSLWHAYR